MGGDSKTVSILKIVRGLIRQTGWLLPAAFAKVFRKSGTTDNTQPETPNHKESLSSLIRLDDFVKKNQELFTKGQFNWLIRRRQENGLSESGALLMISGKFYVNEPKMANWITSQVA
jgi:hypothetical protein